MTDSLPPADRAGLLATAAQEPPDELGAGAGAELAHFYETVPAEFREAVEATLGRFVDEQGELLAPLGPDVQPLVSASRRAMHGGKGLRPAFTYWGWRAAGGAPDPYPIATVAAAIELVHGAALVHDDVMDGSDTRRGRPSAHREFARLADVSASPAAAGRFGPGAAILLGDLLLTWSDQLLRSADLRAADLARAHGYFDRLRTEVMAGQYLDMLAQSSGRVTAAEAMRVVRYKAAKYTVERPLQIGAACADASPALLAALSSYGVPLGEAFQLRDDVLGVFGEPAETGKPAGDDIRGGKPTLLVARALDGASAGQRQALARLLGDPAIDPAGVAAVRRVIRETGALAAVETVIAELTSAALSAVSATRFADRETRHALRRLADQATRRRR
ncbi:MAG TPA: polyprenyl synthetase family protein [Nocardioidaceae bacterium]|nr:polyprenyl synthetase family protein [Nocardioidaceae bacterium]